MVISRSNSFQYHLTLISPPQHQSTPVGTIAIVLIMLTSLNVIQFWKVTKIFAVIEFIYFYCPFLCVQTIDPTCKIKWIENQILCCDECVINVASIARVRLFKLVDVFCVFGYVFKALVGFNNIINVLSAGRVCAQVHLETCTLHSCILVRSIYWTKTAILAI